MAHYLGLDCSTQSLSALVVDAERGKIVADESVPFAALPEFRSPHGFLEHPDPRIKHADPLLWVAALEVLLGRLRQRGVDLARIHGVSGAGQQHGSVYLRAPLDSTPPWRDDAPLHEQLAPLLSRATAPIWLDNATSEECHEIAAAVGGDDELVRVTGSRAIERFTGPQIRRFFKQEPRAYAATAEIHLVSSFVASVLTKTSAPVDRGDGAGMNLLDLQTLDWSPALVAATAPDLASRLPRPVPCDTIVGTVAPYFVRRYGFAPRTPVVVFTGDNPSSLVGMGATTPGTTVISLGTSDTVFAAMERPRTDPRGFGHVFGNPAGGFMSLICFANGSLARETVARRVGLDWAGFERAILQDTKPGNDGALLLPYFVPEMTPRITAPQPLLRGDAAFTTWRDPARSARAIVEAQALVMRRYSDWIGGTPERLLATGGASSNQGILRVIADVFQAEVHRLRVKNASALGAALRAAQVVGQLDWAFLFERFAAPDPAVVVRPAPETRPIYEEMGARLAAEIHRLADR